MSQPIDPAALAALIDKQAITETLHRYPRGIDRCDAAILKTVFWEDGSADFGDGPVPAHQWCEGVVRALRGMDRTAHQLCNILITLEGDTATADTYCQAYHEMGPDGAKQEVVVGGRYLDRLQRRDGIWRILERRYVMDWNRNQPSTANWTDGLYAPLKRHGARYPDDPSYRDRN